MRNGTIRGEEKRVWREAHSVRQRRKATRDLIARGRGAPPKRGEPASKTAGNATAHPQAAVSRGEGQRRVRCWVGVKALCMAIVCGLFLSLKAGAVGTVVGWGFNAQNQAVPPPGLDDVVAIQAGDYHSLALRSDGTVVGWGSNQYGQAIPPLGLSGVVAISAGEYSSLALKEDGSLVGWGWNQYGQTSQPAGFTDVIALAAGAFHSVALKKDGSVLAWGYNGYGATAPPVGLSGVLAIAGAGLHSVALKDDGTVVAWGYNANGQTDVPAGLTDVVAISASLYHSLALKSDGTVVSWGNNPVANVTPPADLTDAIAVVAGLEFSMAVRSDGTVVTWGNAPYSPSIPMPPSLSMVVRIAGGAGHRLALVGDLTPPEITVVGANPVTVYQGASYVDAGATALDAVDGPLMVSVQSDVNPLVSGTYSVTYTATDSHQNAASAMRTVYVIPPPVPVTTLLYEQGKPVPGAGVVGSGVPAGATWSDFGVPAINHAEQVAFLGKWKSPSGSGQGLFVGGSLVLKVGEGIPGSGGLVWRGFSEPLLSEDGSVGIVASVSGTKVSFLNDSMLVRIPPGAAPEVIARTNDVAPGTNGARLRAFEAFSLDGPSVAFCATLVWGTGSPATFLGSDRGIWVKDPGHPLTLALRLSQAIALSTGWPTPLRSFSFLPLTWGSSGMGRGDHAWDGTNTSIRFGARLQDGRSAQMRVVPGGSPWATSESGNGLGKPNLSGALFKSYGNLASDHDGVVQAFFATLTPGHGGVTAGTADGIFVSNPESGLFEVVARQGQGAPGTDGVFGTLRDPVLAMDGSAIAWLGSVKEESVWSWNNAGLWWRPDGEMVQLVAREGAEVPGVPGAKWRSFDSLGLPDAGRGPLFVARMQSGPERFPGPGGVTTSTERGLWALDSNGSLQLLVREGVTQVGSKTLKSFNTLQYTGGLPGVTRTFNGEATVVWRAFFKEGTTALLKTSVP